MATPLETSVAALTAAVQSVEAEVKSLQAADTTATSVAAIDAATAALESLVPPVVVVSDPDPVPDAEDAPPA